MRRDPAVNILQGDALTVLRTLPDNSVDCCVTSPPYFGLRDYGTAQWRGGSPECDHSRVGVSPDPKNPRSTAANGRGAKSSRLGGTHCPRGCGAERIDQQIGHEASPAEWVRVMVDVFREVRRVLAPWGTCWINVGDKYMSDGGFGHQGNANSCRAHRRHTQRNLATAAPAEVWLKPKDLCLLPARLAVALQDDGWWVRHRCIWWKASPMPESTKDRPTTDYEDVLMLTKSADYYFDSFAVMQATTGNAHSRGGGNKPRVGRRTGVKNNATYGPLLREAVAKRNLRAVWPLTGAPFADEKCLACGAYYDARETRQLTRTPDWKLICRCGASDKWLTHFATFPPSLPDLCIRASTSERGNCAACGKPIERIVELPKIGELRPTDGAPAGVKNEATARLGRGAGWRENAPLLGPRHLGWRECCPEADGETRPAVVLDPFAGACTTLMVAERLGRAGLGIELNADYIAMAEERMRRDREKHAQMGMEFFDEEMEYET